VRYLHDVVAELVAVLAVLVRLRNSRMANSYGRWREAPRGAELLHSTLSHTVLASRDCRDRMERRRGAQAKCMCSSEARKPVYRLATAASRILRCALCTHRRIHLQGDRAWVRSAAAVAASLPRVGVAARGVLLFASLTTNVVHHTGFFPPFLQVESLFFLLLPALTLGSTLAR
jgi:hypothetical protein